MPPSSRRALEVARNLGSVGVSVADYKPVSRSKTLARVVLVASTPLRNTHPADITAALSRCLPECTPVLGSFRVVADAKVPCLTGFVSTASPVLSEDEGKEKGLKPVTAAIMLDPSDQSLWDVRKSEAGTFFVRAGEDDINTVLASSRVRNPAAPALVQTAGLSQPREFVRYVRTDGSLGHGFVVASLNEDVEVMPEEEDNTVVVPEDSIIEAAFLHGEDMQVAADLGIDTTNMGGNERLKDYYKQLYTYAPAYVDQLIKQIDSHAAI